MRQSFIFSEIQISSSSLFRIDCIEITIRQFKRSIKNAENRYQWYGVRIGSREPSRVLSVSQEKSQGWLRAPSFYDHNARRCESVSYSTINKTISHTPCRTQTQSTHEDTRESQCALCTLYERMCAVTKPMPRETHQRTSSPLLLLLLLLLLSSLSRKDEN